MPGVEETVRCYNPQRIIMDEAARVSDHRGRGGQQEQHRPGPRQEQRAGVRRFAPVRAAILALSVFIQRRSQACPIVVNDPNKDALTARTGRPELTNFSFV